MPSVTDTSPSATGDAHGTGDRSEPDGFRYDVFISYSHIDNQPFGEAGERWVSKLHDDLKIRLEELMGGKVSVWRDKRLEGNEVFDESILRGISGAAVLVTVLTPRYIKSEWCQKELHAFVQSAQAHGGLEVDVDDGTRRKSRVFKVQKTPVPIGRHPETLQKLLGYDFFEVDPDTKRFREFHLAESDEAQRRYWQRIDDLGQDISGLLEVLAGAAVPAAVGPAVYLAQTTSDMRPARDEMRRDLQQRGFVVLPDGELPPSKDDLETAVLGYLERAKITIHPIGRRFYGAIPEGASRSVVELQLALAMQHNGKASHIIWIPQDAKDSGEERQQDFVQGLIRGSAPALQSGPEALKNIELLSDPLEAVKTYVLDKLAQPERPIEVGGGEEEELRIYLMCDKGDHDAIRPLRNFLFDEGHAVDVIPKEGTELELRELHREFLIDCDAVLVYYGAGSEGWRQTKLMNIRRAPGEGRTKPKPPVGVYLGPPLTDDKKDFRTRDAKVLQGAEEFDPQALLPFLEELKALERAGS